MSHMPGPWSFEEDGAAAAYSDDCGRFVIRSHDEKSVDGWIIAVTIADVEQITPHEEDTARLIAAAPELLAACRALFNVLAPAAGDFTDAEAKAYTQAAEALHKADGVNIAAYGSSKE